MNDPEAEALRKIYLTDIFTGKELINAGKAYEEYI